MSASCVNTTPPAAEVRSAQRLKDGMALHQSGRLSEAKVLYEKVLSSNPQDVNALHFLGLVHLQNQCFEEALLLFNQSLAVNSAQAAVLANRGIALKSLSRAEESVESYDLALKLEPRFPQALKNRAIVLQHMGRFEEALVSAQAAVTLNSADSEARIHASLALQMLGRHEDALVHIQEVLKHHPKHDQALMNQSVMLNELGRVEEAKRVCERLIELVPDHLNALFHLGNIALAQSQFELAIRCFDQALRLDPKDLDIHLNRTVALKNLGRYEEGRVASLSVLAMCADSTAKQPAVRVSSMESSLDSSRVSPQRPVGLGEHSPLDGPLAATIEVMTKAHGLHGDMLQGLGRFEESLESYARALSLTPDFAPAHTNRALALVALHRANEALVDSENAVRLGPEDALFHANHGFVLYSALEFEKATLALQKAVSLNPKLVLAHVNLAYTHQALKQFERAALSFEKAHALDPHAPYLQGSLLHAKMMLCDWSGHDHRVGAMMHSVKRQERASLCLPFLALVDDAALQLEVARRWSEDKYPQSLFPVPWEMARQAAGKIRLGYFSADFRAHPVSFLTAELFELHDKTRFETVAFYAGPPGEDAMQSRLKQAFDRFIDVRHLSDAQVAALARSLAIDIAIDLTGHTEHGRPGIFAKRAAPLQMSYIGYLGSMGMSDYDYILADETLIPREHFAFYSEKVVVLPVYQVNDRKRRACGRVFTREMLKLPDQGFVFACFNNSYKITPPCFDAWMAILRAVPHGVLYLVVSDQAAQQSLMREAKARGVPAERLVFGESLERDDYLARFAVCDLFLDTWPYNAGTTASDALWMGLPVLTKMGESFASRMAASLLRALDKSTDYCALITTTPEQYFVQAIDLAMNPAKLQALKNSLLHNKESVPLFDTPKFTQRLELAYQAMWERHLSGLSPEHLWIKAHDPHLQTMDTIQTQQSPQSLDTAEFDLQV